MNKTAGIAIGLGWIIVVNLVLFIKIGQYMDTKYHIYPWGTLLGTLTAFTTISISLYQIWKRLEDERDHK
jgi:hypothetical protein